MALFNGVVLLIVFLSTAKMLIFMSYGFGSKIILAARVRVFALSKLPIVLLQAIQVLPATICFDGYMFEFLVDVWEETFLITSSLLCEEEETSSHFR